MQMHFHRKLPIPQEVKKEFPVTEEMKRIKDARDDAIRAVSEVIPIANTQVKSITELDKPEVKAFIRNHAITAIKEKAKQSDPLFAEQIAAAQIANIDEVVEEAISTFIDAERQLAKCN